MRTFVKSLVIGLIIIVGGGLLVAGIVRVRQAADRSQCRNNVRALGVAIHNYHDTWDAFPEATLSLKAVAVISLQPAPVEAVAQERRLSWYPSILFYVEQLGGMFLLDPMSPWDSPENCPPRFRRSLDDERNGYRDEVFEMNVWWCPTNPSREPPGMPSFTHYVGVAGLGEDALHLQAYDPLAGVFGYGRHTSLKEIQRGTGHTLMLIETAWQNGPWTAGGFSTSRGLIPGSQPYLGVGGQFGGSHPGGGWAAFADGSVRFLPDAISPQVLEDLATIRGGSPAGED